MADRSISEGVASSAPSVYFETLGCAKNEVDTRDMQEALRASGYRIAETIDDCDAIVVNTCSFIRPAIEESIDAFFELSDAESVRARGIPVIVAGCLPARFGDELSDAMTEAAAFVPCAEEESLPGILASLVQSSAVAREGEGLHGDGHEVPDGLRLLGASPT